MRQLTASKPHWQEWLWLIFNEKSRKIGGPDGNRTHYESLCQWATRPKKLRTHASSIVNTANLRPHFTATTPSHNTATLITSRVATRSLLLMLASPFIAANLPTCERLGISVRVIAYRLHTYDSDRFLKKVKIFLTESNRFLWVSIYRPRPFDH